MVSGVFCAAEDWKGGGCSSCVCAPVREGYELGESVGSVRALEEGCVALLGFKDCG